MTPKEYLSQIEKLSIIIKQKKEESRELKELCLCAGGIDYSKDKIQASAGDAGFENMIEKIIELDSKINNLISIYAELKNKIINEIQQLNNPTYVKILYKRYVEYKTLNQIAKEMNYTYDWIKHVHGYALQEFGKKTPKDTRRHQKTPKDTF